MLEYTSQRRFRLILTWRTKVVTKMFTNFLVLTCGFRYFWTWRNIRKRVRWNRRLRLLYTLWIGVSRKFHLHFIYTYVLVYKMVVQSLSIQKLVSKITGTWATSDKQWKVQKVEIWWAFVQKNTLLQLKHNIQWIYLTLLWTNCVQIHQITYAIFETISHFSQHNSSVSF